MQKIDNEDAIYGIYRGTEFTVKEVNYMIELMKKNKEHNKIYGWIDGTDAIREEKFIKVLKELRKQPKTEEEWLQELDKKCDYVLRPLEDDEIQF